MEVYIIGAGAGDPELMTIKGKNAMEEADVIIYAGSLVNSDILEYAPNAEVYNSASMNLEEVIGVIEKAVNNDMTVARIHTGDPSLYGAIQEQIDILKQKNIEYEIIPGVSSFLAAAAAIEREFTLPDVSQTVIITRLEGRTPVPERESLDKLAVHRSSMAIFLSIHMIEDVVEKLKKGYNKETPVAVVARASWPDEQIVKGTLNDIVSRVKEAEIEKTSMILIGDFIESEYSLSKLYNKDFSHEFRDSQKAKKAILVVSFGTSYHQTRKLTIAACENKIADSYSDYELRRAFTSGMIIKKLKERDNIHIDTPSQAFKKLKEEGFSEVLIQPLHIIPGSEYHDLIKDTELYRNYFNKVIASKPLLYDVEDYIEVAEAVSSQFPVLNSDEAVVLMGHGSKHPANAAYANLDYVFKDLGMADVFVGTVEGYPELDSVIKKLKLNNIKKVHLMPFMLVAGDHACNDMAGDEENSWKSILGKEGFDVEIHLQGLGENEKIQQLYVKKVDNALCT